MTREIDVRPHAQLILAAYLCPLDLKLKLDVLLLPDVGWL